MKKVVKEIIIRTACLGAGAALIASIPFWGFLAKKSDEREF